MSEDKGRPIRPDEVAQAKVFPKAVFAAFNELIAEKYQSRRAVIRQDAVIERILAKDPTLRRGDIFDKGWLDVEDLYRAQGWIVEYDKPGYCETYEATFTFTSEY